MKKVLFVLLVMGVLMLGSVIVAEEIAEESLGNINFLKGPNSNISLCSGEGGGSGSGGAPG